MSKFEIKFRFSIWVEQPIPTFASHFSHTNYSDGILYDNGWVDLGDFWVNIFDKKKYLYRQVDDSWRSGSGNEKIISFVPKLVTNREVINKAQKAIKVFEVRYRNLESEREIEYKKRRKEDMLYEKMREKAEKIEEKERWKKGKKVEVSTGERGFFQKLWDEFWEEDYSRKGR